MSSVAPLRYIIRSPRMLMSYVILDKIRMSYKCLIMASVEKKLTTCSSGSSAGLAAGVHAEQDPGLVKLYIKKVDDAKFRHVHTNTP